MEPEQVCETFAKIHDSGKIRLARGAAERARVFTQLKAGIECDSYRLAWLSAAVTRCIGQMGNAAHEFNETYTHDQCSVQDLIDILEMAAEKLRNG